MLGTDGTPNRDAVRLGRVIRERRGALNMTQPELAERAGVSPAYIYMLEVGGLLHPGLESLLQVARAIDQTHLVELLEEVVATRAGAPLPSGVEEVATAEAVTRFLRETRA
jgi:transcriptional regulator with XRE-family HTH domain